MGNIGKMKGHIAFSISKISAVFFIHKVYAFGTLNYTMKTSSVVLKKCRYRNISLPEDII
jgi:hypothetical protein